MIALIKSPRHLNCYAVRLSKHLSCCLDKIVYSIYNIEINPKGPDSYPMYQKYWDSNSPSVTSYNPWNKKEKKNQNSIYFNYLSKWERNYPWITELVHHVTVILMCTKLASVEKSVETEDWDKTKLWICTRGNSLLSPLWEDQDTNDREAYRGHGSNHKCKGIHLGWKVKLLLNTLQALVNHRGQSSGTSDSEWSCNIVTSPH